ncbi:hypothetical protein GOV14_05140 [Candidatus Pacearchaeota archaeon]|nr:hypothetical protein [Candidatus Pacearchaeota archaeon]
MKKHTKHGLITGVIASVLFLLYKIFKPRFNGKITDLNQELFSQGWTSIATIKGFFEIIGMTLLVLIIFFFIGSCISYLISKIKKKLKKK